MKIDDEIKDQPEPAPVEEAPAPVVETPVQEAKPTEELPADLEALLRAAHDNYVISNDSDITFENYIATSTTAARIKDNYYKKAQASATEEDVYKNAPEGFNSQSYDEVPDSNEEVNIEPTKESGVKKAQDILNSVSSIKDLPNLNAVNGNPFTFKLLDLISSGEITSKEVMDIVEKRRQELSENLSINDIKTGDIVIFVDGRKGIVKTVNKNGITVKPFNSKSKTLETIPDSLISKKIKMVESGKIAAVEETVQVEVAPENKPEVEASKDTVDSFTSDAARVKNAINDVMANTGKDNSNNIQNIIDNMGCKTKGA